MNEVKEVNETCDRIEAMINEIENRIKNGTYKFISNAKERLKNENNAKKRN
jgi:hypothetical protein